MLIVQFCPDGDVKRNVAKLQEAFHRDARATNAQAARDLWRQ
jgi:hypothetical protein